MIKEEEMGQKRKRRGLDGRDEEGMQGRRKEVDTKKDGIT
jgi:hypothetical protein